MVKLGEDSEVEYALRGYDELSKQEIMEVYGCPPVMKVSFPEASRQLETEKGAHWILSGPFDKCKVPLICHLLDLKKKG